MKKKINRFTYSSEKGIIIIKNENMTKIIKNTPK